MATPAASPSVKGSAPAATGVSKSLTKIILRQRDVNAPKWFALGIGGIVVLFMIYQWTRSCYGRYGPRNPSNRLLRGSIAISRAGRGLLIHKVPGFPSFGHLLIFLGYWTICFSVTFTDIFWTDGKNISKRLGRTALSTLCLATVLSLKNTPLAALTSYSYERLNFLHQLAGYSFVFWTVLHAVVYIITWAKSDNLAELLEQNQVMGIIAGLSALIILSTSLVMRKRQYEIWYIVHVVFFMLIVVTVGLHQPDIALRVYPAAIFAGAIWFLDRLLRFSKISWYSFSNQATVVALPHGGTRISVKKTPVLAVPGAHVFLWIPGIRAVQTHPFTIVSTKPLELVVKAHDGFTRALHARAQERPDQALKVSIDGPYGIVPDFLAFTKVLIIAGGSGASFSLGVAADLVRRLGGSTKTSIEVVWAIREEEMVSWYIREVEELQSSPMVHLRIHATRRTDQLPINEHSSRPSSSAKSPIDDEKAALSLLQDEKPDVDTSDSPISPESSEKYLEIDIEKHPEVVGVAQSRTLSVCAGRPDLEAIVNETIRTAAASDRVAVAACGPVEMMNVTRRTVARCITPDGPSLELFCEQFGY